MSRLLPFVVDLSMAVAAVHRALPVGNRINPGVTSAIFGSELGEAQDQWSITGRRSRDEIAFLRGGQPHRPEFGMGQAKSSRFIADGGSRGSFESDRGARDWAIVAPNFAHDVAGLARC